MRDEASVLAGFAAGMVGLVDDLRTVPLVRSWQRFLTLESSGCPESNEEHRARVVDCAQVPFENASAERWVPGPTCPVEPARLTRR